MENNPQEKIGYPSVRCSSKLYECMSAKYSVAKALARVPVLQYFSTKLCLAKEAGFEDTNQQLLTIWNGLDIEIRDLIDEPDSVSRTKSRSHL
jgi:hypothetical protein